MNNRLTLAGACLCLLAGAALADEGMWMPRQIADLAPELKAAGMTLDPAKLTDLTGDPMGAVVSLGGCTASFVSPQGLIITNHHCVYGSMQFNSTPERNLIANGFLAAELSEELPAAPGTYVYVTTGIRDVTKEVLGNPAAKLLDADYARQVERRSRMLVDACEKPGGRRCSVARFYEGSLFLEVTQMEIRDVRLAYASGEGIGNFGGEVDNWMWPRHTGDFGFLRAYVGPDGKPADFAKENVPYRPQHFMKMATEGVKEGDFVWIAGYPGRTFRYRTLDEVETAHDYSLPQSVKWSKDQIAILEMENLRGTEVELANYGRVRGMANGMKKYEGQLLAMRGGAVEAQRAAREQELEKLATGGASPLATLRSMNALRRETEQRDTVLAWLGRSSPMLSQAMTIWRMSEERPKADLDREDGFRDRDLSRYRQGVARAQRSIEPASDRATLRYALQQAVALPAGQRIAVLDAELQETGKADDETRIEALLDKLYAGTKMADLAARKEAAEQSSADLAKRGDSMLDLARKMAPLAAERREADRAFEGATLRIRPEYMKGLEKLAGGRLYPDANSTLRFTYGKVTGYVPRDGVAYGPQTSLAGVVAKTTGERPFDSPPALVEAAKAVPSPYIDKGLGSVPVDFLSTCDITGGNSGSATLNGKGEIVGLAFDGNWEGVVSDFLFDPASVRTIHVDAVYIRWVMDEVDKAHNLLREMALPVHTPDH
ncbi:MAG: S46 family peptidase [Thermoanaerobaculia bacterium]|nr:S46 family peptidase [Thermoanaerobaculia bacterium]